jgi:hypothetical protein
MTANNLPPRPCTLLRVWSEPWEEECPRCKGTGIAFKSQLSKNANGDWYCEDCGGFEDDEKGTGTRRVRLAGWVVVSYAERASDRKFLGFSLYGEHDHDDFMTEKELRTYIVAAYRAGSLPPSVRGNLEIVEVKEE